MSTLYHGFDVSKNTLDICGQVQGGVANTRKELTAFLKRLLKLDGTAHVVCEATGGYESLLVQICHDLGILVSVVDPKRVRSFARAHGKVAKTDEIDARMIKEFADAVKPIPTPRKSASRQQLDALVTRRGQLIKDLGRHRAQIELVDNAVVLATTATVITALEAALAAVEAEIKRVIAIDAELAEQSEALQEMVGVGHTVATILLATTPELGMVNRRTIANLIGVAPLNNDSGTKTGKRQISAGRTMPRNALYMAALTASHRCPKCSEIYKNLLKKGKPKKVALVAIMRQMLIVANNIMKDYYRTKQDAGAMTASA
jgi:transposase